MVIPFIFFSIIVNLDLNRKSCDKLASYQVLKNVHYLEGLGNLIIKFLNMIYFHFFAFFVIFIK